MVRYSTKVQTQLVLAHANSRFRRDARCYFRELGIRVAGAGSAEECRQLVRDMRTSMVVLDSGLSDESGYLACAKIKADNPSCKIILLIDRGAADGPGLARFAGADAWVNREEGLQGLASRVAAATAGLRPVPVEIPENGVGGRDRVPQLQRQARQAPDGSRRARAS